MAEKVTLRCYPHSTSASAVLYTGLPDWEEMSFVLDALDPGDTFVDVGANIGMYSLLAATVPGVSVLSFEPSSIGCARLNENVALNDFHSRVRIVRAAVGDVAGTALFTKGMDTVNRVVTQGYRGEVERVTLVALDGFLADPALLKVSIIKVDVEGHELEVLRGASEILRTLKPALIVERNNPEALFCLLRSYGYSPFHYEPTARSLTRIGWRECLSDNLLVFNNVEPFKERVRRRGSERQG